MVKHDQTNDIRVPDHVLSDWQDIANILAESVGVPAVLVTRIDGQDLEVLISSESPENPCSPGDRGRLYGSGAYCERVITSNRELLVKDALAEEEWKNNPDVKKNLISYFGVPILFPNNAPFGTICVLDKKANEYSDTHRRLVFKLRDLMQNHLSLLYMNRTLGDENRHLNEYVNEIRALRGILPICSFCRSIRDQDGTWIKIEKYVTQHAGAAFTHTFCPECGQKHYGTPDGKGAVP